MKLTFKIISITIIMIVMGFTTFFLTKAESVIEEEISLICDSRVDNVIHYNDGEIIESDKVITIQDLIINGKIKDYIIDGVNAYLLINNQKNYIYKITDNKVMQVKEILMSNPRTLGKYQNNIIVGGSNLKQMSLAVYNLNLDYSKSIVYDTNGFTECVKMTVIDNYLYIGGIKDAVFESSTFKNVGNVGEIKSFIFKLDSSFRLITDGYFNELTSDEQIFDMFDYQHSLGIIIRTNKDYQYILDINLNVKSRAEINKNSHYVLTNKKVDEGVVYISEHSEYLNLESIKENKYNSIASIEGDYLNHYFQEGEVYIYYIYDEKTYVKGINEYHIDYLNTLYKDYYDNDETSQDHFKVGSYLEDLTFEISDITPTFVKNQGGKYEITYLATRENEDELKITTPFIVSEYANVKDGEIYVKGYQLFFFGEAKLNGKTITNGAILTDVGVNNLIITNANNETFKYQFIVVDGYYKNNYLPTIDADFVIEQNESLMIPLSKKEVKSVVVNSIEIGNIQKVNNEYCLCLNYQNDYKFLKIGPQIITIDKVNYQDGTSSDVKLRFILLIEKLEPLLEIKESKENNQLHLNIDVDDNDQSIVDIIIEVYQQNKLVDTYSTYLKNTKDKIKDLNLNETFEIYIKLITENNIYNLMYYQGTMTKKHSMGYEINFEYDENSLKVIDLNVDLSDDNIHHEILKLGNETKNLNSKYQVTKNKIIIYISIIVSIIIVGGVIVLLIRKIKKKKVSM